MASKKELVEDKLELLGDMDLFSKVKEAKDKVKDKLSLWNKE